MIPMTVTVAGWTGEETSVDLPAIRRNLWSELDAQHPGIHGRYQAGDPDAERLFAAAAMDHMSGHAVAKAHRNAAPLADEYATVTEQAHRAVRQAEQEYNDLSQNTTINWLAAHHRFVLTTQTARDLLERRVEIAEDLQQYRQVLTNEPTCFTYAKYVPAQHRITFPAPDDCKVQLTSFIETSTERFAATRVTITGGYPTGFQPAPIEHEPFERPAGEEVAWPASPAVVAGERHW